VVAAAKRPMLGGLATDARWVVEQEIARPTGGVIWVRHRWARNARPDLIVRTIRSVRQRTTTMQSMTDGGTAMRQVRPVIGSAPLPTHTARPATDRRIARTARLMPQPQAAAMVPMAVMQNVAARGSNDGQGEKS
jgi:hypothetical protein